MKPIIIYSLPRARSTATLQSCIAENKFNEPFDLNTIWGEGHKKSVKSVLYQHISVKYWENLFQKLNSQNTVSKFFGNSLYHCLPARKWWNDVIKNQSHDIFILERNLIEVFLSHIIARQQDTFTYKEIEILPFEATNIDFFVVESLLDRHLRFFPNYGTIVTFDTLPKSHFAKEKINIKDQTTFLEYNKIKNLQETLNTLNEIVSYYQNDMVDIMANGNYIRL